jgi:molybdate transport system ATP-binding protein
MVLSVDIRLSYGDFTLEVVRDFPPSGVTGVFGPSGSGKSTLLRVIAGLETRARGRVTVNSEAWQEGNRHLAPHRRGVGYVFQDTRLFPHLDVMGNLDYALRRAKDLGGPGMDEIVGALDLGPLLGRRPSELSGGEKQRVAIGRTLLTAPKILLMDEPLAALDEARKAEIFPYLERLRDQTRVPILYVTHSMEEVTRLADHMVLLDRGRVVASGRLDDLTSRLDLPLLVDRPDVGAVLMGSIAGHDAERGVTRIDVSGAEFLLSHVELPVGHAVRLRVLARDVAIATRRPEELSVQNVLAGRLSEMVERPNQRCLLRIAVGQAGGAVLLSLLTADSARRLHLHPGQEVFALVKSVASSALI